MESEKSENLDEIKPENREWLEDLLGKAGLKPEKIEYPKVSKRVAKSFGGAPVRSVTGQAVVRPTKRLSGKCSQCDRPARRRFQNTPFCNPCYRKDLERRWAENYDAKKRENVT